MGLDRLSPEKGKGKGGKSSKRQYVQITEKEVEEFFDGREENWERTPHPSGELVWSTNDFAPQDNKLRLVCFTTIDKKTGVSRDKGADAMRLVAWYLPRSAPVSGRSKTLRIKTWRKNLGQKIDSIMADGAKVVTSCDDCGSPMVERDGKFGKFLGCISYPDCKNTANIDD